VRGFIMDLNDRNGLDRFGDFEYGNGKYRKARFIDMGV
jgi:hypothetical protein